MHTRLIFVAIALAIAIPAGAQSGYTPRTPWGEPDLTGKWPANDMQGTP